MRGTTTTRITVTRFAILPGAGFVNLACFLVIGILGDERLALAFFACAVAWFAIATLVARR